MAWCPLPWSHIGVKNNGTLRMCSHSQNGIGNTVLEQEGRVLTLDDLATTDVLNCDTLKRVRREFLAGRYPDDCRRCEIEAKAGKQSRDQWEAEQHKDILTPERAFAMMDTDGTVDHPFVASYDLRLGNTCNLRCAPCYPGESNKWFEDYETITGYSDFAVDGMTYGLDPAAKDFEWLHDEPAVAALVAKGKGLRKITFGGGEPLIIKQHLPLIKELADRGWAPGIELEYSTNLTLLPAPILRRWEPFKHVKLCLSIDGVGEVNEAVRFPSRWEMVEKNLRKVEEAPDNISAFTSSTVHLLTIEHYADFMLWLVDQKFKKINAGMSPVGIAHPVHYPQHLNIALLEDHQREHLFAGLYAKVGANKTMRSRIEVFENFARHNTPPNAAIMRKQFVRVYDGFEHAQGGFTRLFPLATRWVEEWRG